MMGMDNTAWMWFYAAVGAYLFYRLFFKKSKLDIEYERMYNEILNSEKYKVKGQYDR
jgi:hypothetical protein